MKIRIILMTMACILAAGCAPEDTLETTDAATADSTEPAAADPAPAAEPELAGTAWRLLNIAEMNDNTDIPDDPAKYTLVLNPDGTANMRADCNRGKGSWTSESSGQLQFGPVAATRALCPPGSLSEKYLAQFQWVRSYVLKDGHLFLATMADGAIIEFEPLPPVAARVFGEEVRTADATEMQDAIVTLVFDRYAAENGLVPEEAEIDAFVENMQQGMAERGMTAEDDLTEEEAGEVATMRRQMGNAVIRNWKINKSLYEAYGGRIIYQQFGPEPLDAYREYLEELQDAGRLKIVDEAMAETFWRYFTDDSKHDFMESGSEDEALVFATPPWEEQT